MITQYLLPISLFVGTLFLWGAIFLPFHWLLRLFFWLAPMFGLAYIVPIGIYIDPASFLPYPFVLICAFGSAFSFVYLFLKAIHFYIALFVGLFSIAFTKIRKLTKFVFCSSRLHLASILCSIIFACFGLYEAIKVPEVRHITIEYKNLPDNLNNYKIAILADTHLGYVFKHAWLEKVVASVNAQKPHIILHAGDIGDKDPNKIAKDLAPLENLKARDGVYYVFGNHETYHGLHLWQRYFTSKQWKYLENEAILIKDNLALSGIKSYPQDLKPNYDELFKTIPDNAFRLHLDHYPRRFTQAQNYVDLQISGHTHGGTAFFLAPLIAKFNNGFVSGLYEASSVNNIKQQQLTTRQAKLYVSNGTGLWSYTPFRFFVPSEITLITLKKENK